MISVKYVQWGTYYHVLLAALRPRNIKPWSYECLFTTVAICCITYHTFAHYNLNYRLIMAPKRDITHTALIRLVKRQQLPKIRNCQNREKFKPAKTYFQRELVA